MARARPFVRALGVAAVGLLCFGPPMLLILGVVPEISGPVRVSTWSLQGYFGTVWGRFVVAFVWFALGYLCFRAATRKKR
jgi:hypothetical protein